MPLGRFCAEKIAEAVLLNACYIQRAKLYYPISHFVTIHKGPTYCHGFIWKILSHGSNKTPDGIFFAEKVVYLVLLNLFRIGFPKSLFRTVIYCEVSILLVFYQFQLQKKTQSGLHYTTP